MDDAALAVRRRLYEDFGFYAEAAVRIRTKSQGIEPLRLNRAQRRLLAVIEEQIQRRGYVRLVVLKGRQMGSSTFFESWLYWWVSQRMAQKALVVAHKAESTQALFDMTRRIHEKMPEVLRPSTKYSSRKELLFDKLDSSYTIVTAGGDGIVRGETITAAHLSEVAFWPKSTAKENFSGLMDAIPPVPGTAVFIESTANGMSGLFFEQYRLAERGEGDFAAVFLPWFWDPGYRSPVPKGFERTPKEQDLVQLYGLDDEQLMFRRIKIAEKGEDLFKQEYPCCAEEAFLTSGRPVFHPERVAEFLRECRDPIAKLALEGGTFAQHPLGELLCYLPHDPHETYYIGADVGAGVRKDWSVAQVLDSQRRQAAIWRGQIDPDFFGTTLAALGRFYNDALVICERNNHGILTNRVMHKDEGYPYVFQETVYDKVTDTETTHIGFYTSEKSKPLIIDKLRAEVRSREVTIYDRTTLEEMQQFIVTETGKMEAEKGCHDDTVIALALANHINEGAFAPITNEDTWYGTIE